MTLLDTRWVNDTIIKSYLMLLGEFADKHREDCPTLADVQLMKCSLFYGYLVDTTGEYQFYRVRQSFRRDKKLMLRELLLLPVNYSENHWILVVINIKRSRFELYDPSWTKQRAPKYKTILENVRSWMRDEYNTDHRRTFYVAEYHEHILDWPFHVPTKTQIPQQTDGSSCGIFVMAYARELTLGRRVEDSQFKNKHVAATRKRISLDVKEQTIARTVGAK